MLRYLVRRSCVNLCLNIYIYILFNHLGGCSLFFQISILKSSVNLNWKTTCRVRLRAGSLGRRQTIPIPGGYEELARRLMRLVSIWT
ncbi:hypothetical protein AALO_G00090420 [Alosa alosa]|uniref:Uncharacterized protein n=1 Tax=Alosa alosa TaxID=278164 RepID=A0AAV6GVE9_9TELE|nr:hypothetical protein AALO_G00090420 [Alosa alosa]